MMRYLRSLQVRLAASYLLLSVLVLGVTALIFSAVFISYARQVYTTRLALGYRQAAALVNEANDPPEQVRQRLQDFFPEFEVTLTSPRMLEGERLLPRVAESELPLPQVPEVAPRLVLAFAAPRQEQGFYLTYLRPGIPLTGFLLTPRQNWTVVLRDLVPHLAAVGVVVLGLAGLTGWWFSRRLARPLGQLAAATAQVAGGDLAQTVPPTGMQELDILVEQFNRMSRALSRSFDSLAAERDVARRFAADAAHELKTPLTALRAYHELSLTAPERREQALAATGRQIGRLEQIVAALVRMAQITEGGAALVPLDLTAWLRQDLPVFEAQVAEAGHSLVLGLPDAALVATADPDLLAIALGNLVENACKFTAPGGTITLALGIAAEEAVLSVTDTGRGIAPDELPHVFQRFRRGIDTQALPGSGLGLPIAQEAVTRMGGRITVTSEPGRGSCFSIHLGPPTCPSRMELASS